MPIFNIFKKYNSKPQLL